MIMLFSPSDTSSVHSLKKSSLKCLSSPAVGSSNKKSFAPYDSANASCALIFIPLDRIADYIAYMQAGRLLFFKPKDAACEHFRIVTGPVYKCKLIPREAVVYMEEGTYSSTAMVIRDKCILVDRELQEHTPDIRELIHYLVKGGKENAENIVEKYFG
jgi:hypothetical protein